LTIASLTEPLVNLATDLIGSIGLGAVALLTTISGVVGFPGSEPTMLFAGFDVFRGTLTLPGVIVAGVAGDVLGASIAYGIGHYGRREVLGKPGSKLRIPQRRLDRAHNWFERYGTWSVLLSRFTPIVRLALPYAAGVAELSFKRFLAMATLGSIFWIGGLALIGRSVGHNWPAWRHHLAYVDYVGLALIVGLVGYLLFRRTRSGRGDRTADAVSG
jgi:membrane protein DedA with SNARE-associated domain